MRKRILIAIIILIVFRINAQTNIDSTAIYFNQKKYDKIINFASKKGDYISLINVANQFFQEENFKMTINFFLKSIEIGKNEMRGKKDMRTHDTCCTERFRLENETRRLTK